MRYEIEIFYCLAFYVCIINDVFVRPFQEVGFLGCETVCLVRRVGR